MSRATCGSRSSRPATQWRSGLSMGSFRPSLGAAALTSAPMAGIVQAFADGDREADPLRQDGTHRDTVTPRSATSSEVPPRPVVASTAMRVCRWLHEPENSLAVHVREARSSAALDAAVGIDDTRVGGVTSRTGTGRIAGWRSRSVPHGLQLAIATLLARHAEVGSSTNSIRYLLRRARISSVRSPRPCRVPPGTPRSREAPDLDRADAQLPPAQAPWRKQRRGIQSGVLGCLEDGLARGAVIWTRRW